MRIGLNAMFWRLDGMGGTQTYLLELLNALLATGDDELIVFLGAQAAQLPLQSPRLRVVNCPLPARGRAMHLVWEHAGFWASAHKSRIDVLHSLGYLAPPVGDLPHVVTVLDLVHYAFPTQIKPLKRMLWSYLLPASLRRVSAIITISDSVRSEMAKRFPWAATKAVTVPLGVDHSRFSPGVTPHKRSPSILAVASPFPHKNLDGLLRAFARVRVERNDVILRLAGMHTPTSGRLMELAQRLCLGGAVEFLGRVSDDQLADLYRDASVMAFPSLYEGFGLPLLEAMASGCPVVCGNCAAVREVVGDAALITDVTDPVELASSLLQILDTSSEAANQLRERGFARASLFTWAETARRTRAVYESLA